MEKKRIISMVLALSMTLMLMPGQIIGGDYEDIVYEYMNESIPYTIYSESKIDLNLISQSDTSITISWSEVSVENLACYEVIFNDSVISNIETNSYTLTGLTSGDEYAISVNAYDFDGNIISSSECLYVNTDWNISSDIMLTSNKIVSNLNISNGTLNLNGYTLTVKGNVYLGATGTTYSYLNINNGSIYVDGDFNISHTNGTYSYGRLIMQNLNDYVFVKGNFYTYARYESTLTNGTLEVQGNFIHKYSSSQDTFLCTGSHRTILSGVSMQTVDFASMSSGFNVLDIRNFSVEGVVFTTPVSIKTINANGCNISFYNGEKSGWTLEENETFEGDLYLGMGTLNLNGHKLTITGNLIQSGGSVNINGGELEVQGDYRIQTFNNNSYGISNGILNMTNEADIVSVYGDFVMQSTVSHSGLLSAGTLEVGGNFTHLSGSNYSFYASGTHTVILNGDKKQTVSIAYNNKDYSRINNFKIINTSEEGVVFASGFYVVGKLYNTTTPVSNGIKMNLAETAELVDNAWSYDIYIYDNRKLTANTEIGGTLYLDRCTLDLNGYTLTVKKDVYLGASNSTTYLYINKGELYVDGNLNITTSGGNYNNGRLKMIFIEDYILVKGNFITFLNDSSYGYLTAGSLEVKGDFTQKCRSYADNFYPTGTHKVILSGDKLQTVSFDSIESRFNILEIQNYSDDGVKFATAITIGELNQIGA